MHPDVAKLMVLQGMDLEAKRLREEMAALPKLVAALDTKAKAVGGQRAVVLDLMAKEDAMRRRQQSDVADLQAKIAKSRAKREQATTAAHVAAFEHEIEFAQKEVSRLEDAELESMERSEGLEAQKSLADKALAEAEEKHKSERVRAIATVDKDIALVAALDGERAMQRKTIGEAALSTYDRIAKSKGTGVSDAANQKCSACQMLVRPQKWNDLRERENTEMMTCESCGRLLFYDPARDSPQRKVVQAERTESIAAQIVRGL